MTQEERAGQMSATLREIARVIRMNPEHIDVWERVFSFLWVTAYDEREVNKFIDAVLPVARQDFGGDLGVRKLYSGNSFFVQAYIGVLKVECSTQRQNVCDRVVIGTEEVTKEVPDPKAPMVTVTETKEIVEWKCRPLLGDNVDE